MVERLGGWRVQLAEPLLAGALEPALAALARGEPPAGAALVKRSHVRQVLRAPLGDGSEIFLKWAWRKRARWRRPDAAAEYENLRRVRAAGIAAVAPLAWAQRDAGRRHETLLVTRAAAGATPVRDLLRTADAGAELPFLVAAAAFLRRLHEARLWHRDFHAGNLLAADGALVLVDLQKLFALPVGLPAALRARDLIWLVRDGRGRPLAPPHEIARAYLDAAPGGPALERFATLLERASARAARIRLASRGRRCVVPSTGFRIEWRGRLRVLRRADVTTGAALEAAALAAPQGERRLDAFQGGPPPGPAPDCFDRGQGAPEPAAPADGAARLCRFSGGLGHTRALTLAHPGLRAWRHAHALLLRGLDTPAPLALVETRRSGVVAHSVLITRCVDDAVPLAEGIATDAASARAVGAELARLHALGVELAGASLRLRPASGTLVALAPEAARIRAALAPPHAERDLAALAAPLTAPAREALLAGYRAAERS